ncbi:hypothetical protein FSP39_024103 [Pinctada imbricata]|uniref:GPR180/TMEM145 transmembrane domain-containing protein n=1 Tax=Pinctada imbricata TaxID=66713 RepID=A0AA88XYB9_PINIB|nr:hypothetical protein FSP39_024103 [Pinctada imbricata]
MFNKIDTIAFDYPCQTNGTQDFIRKIPCPKNRICTDEDTPENLVPGYQFTYKLQDVYLPRFWYVSMVSCYRNTTKNNCSWVNNESENIEIEYDIWLVNGNPDSKHLNPFEHQFSFEDHDIFECYFTEIDAISNIDEWQTWPGIITCGFRLCIMVWFILEVRHTFQINKDRSRLQFLQQFGAYFLVWFIYLPVLALISTQFSALWKRKTILSEYMYFIKFSVRM